MSLRDVLITKKRTASIASPVIEECVFMYFSGDETARRANFIPVRDFLDDHGRRPPKTLVVPRHEPSREFDRIICRIVDEDEQQTDWFLKMLELLPEFCKSKGIPYAIDRESATHGDQACTHP